MRLDRVERQEELGADLAQRQFAVEHAQHRQLAIAELAARGRGRSRRGEPGGLPGLRHRAGQDARVGATRQQLLGVRETGARRLAPAEGGEHAGMGHCRGGPFEDPGAAP